MSASRTHSSQSDALEGREKHEEVIDSEENESSVLTIASPVDERRLGIDRNEKKYDAFVVHCTADRQWAETLCYNLEMGHRLKLCFPWRDFDKSRDPMENLISTLSQSRLVLIIVSKNYSVSQSCQKATEEALVRCRDGIIRVILEEGTHVPKLGGLWKIELFDDKVHNDFFKHLADLMRQRRRYLEQEEVPLHQNHEPPELLPTDTCVQNEVEFSSPVADIRVVSSPESTAAQVPISELTEDRGRATELHDSHSDDDRTSTVSSSLGQDIGNSVAVAEWYNQLPERGAKFRLESPIFHLRNFNNWIKSVLIRTYLDRLPHNRNPIVLDLCCGKGGDVLKWKKGRVGYLIMADIAETSVKQAKDRLEHNRVGIKAEFHVADCTRVCLWESYKEIVKWDGIDLTSCQFSFHYCFESESQALMMIRNACGHLRPGGFFIGTMPNAYELVHRVRDSDSHSFSNTVCGVSFETEPDDQGRYPLFGAKYHFHLEGVVDVPEYLVYFPLLEKMLMDECGMERVLCQSFYDFFENNRKRVPYARLLQDMQALKAERNDDGSYYGTISQDEWEAIGLYLVFAFRKPRVAGQGDKEEREATYDRFHLDKDDGYYRKTEDGNGKGRSHSPEGSSPKRTRYD